MAQWKQRAEYMLFGVPSKYPQRRCTMFCKKEKYETTEPCDHRYRCRCVCLHGWRSGNPELEKRIWGSLEGLYRAVLAFQFLDSRYRSTWL